jgi:hypothetical protein
MMNTTWKELNRLAAHIATVEPGTDEYDRVLKNYNDIIHIQNSILGRKEFDSRMDVLLKNPALLGVIGNLAIAVLVLNFERLGIITSRAFNFIRPK